MTFTIQSTTPLHDGRQSQAALGIARGTRRLLVSLGYTSLTELSLANGRRADIVAQSDKGEIWIIEIKSSVVDFRTDNKWPEYQEFADRLLFAVAPDFPIEILPATTGLILADAYGGDLARPAPLQPLAPARRKAMLQRIARTACLRLQALSDPDFMREWIE